VHPRHVRPRSSWLLLIGKVLRVPRVDEYTLEQYRALCMEQWSDRADQMVFLAELYTESHRGAVLVASSYFDVVLERMLRQFMVSAVKVDHLFEGLNAPLGSFNAKIEFSYALGVIRKDEHRALSFVRRIRNVFAHRLEVTFKHKDVVKEFLKIQDISDQFNSTSERTPHEVFLMTCLLLNTDLFHRESVVRENRLSVLTTKPGALSRLTEQT